MSWSMILLSLLLCMIIAKQLYFIFFGLGLGPIETPRYAEAVLLRERAPELPRFQGPNRIEPTPLPSLQQCLLLLGYFMFQSRGVSQL